MNYYRTVFLAIILTAISLPCIRLQAAVFTVTNNSDSSVRFAPRWEGSPKTLDTLEPSKSKQYDSGLNTVTGMRWSIGQTVFVAEVKLGKINLGGKFEIKKDGLFSYYFGIDGSGTGQASKTVVVIPSRPTAKPAFSLPALPPSQPITQEQQKIDECNSRLTGRESGSEEEAILAECRKEAMKEIPAQQKYDTCISRLTGRESGSEEEAIKQECRKNAGL